jgi:hypothetical protein
MQIALSEPCVALDTGLSDSMNKHQVTDVMAGGGGPGRLS